MRTSAIIFAGSSLLLFSTVAAAQDASARTVQYHAQDIIPIRAKLKYTTLIEVPATEKIMEAATGDKDFWVVDVDTGFTALQTLFTGTVARLAKQP